MSDVTVADVKGSVQLEGEFQESVKLERIAKTVTFKSSRTDMEFSQLGGSLDLDSDDLHADQVAGPLHLATRSKNIRLEGVSGDVRVKNDNGTVELIMRNLGNVQIDNRNGDIQPRSVRKGRLPSGCTDTRGDIQFDFPELNVTNEEREVKASGNVGNGSSHIVINNEHEGIEIRRASATPPMPPVPPNPAKPSKALPQPKDKVEPTEN
jgi:hypothetical protein